MRSTNGNLVHLLSVILFFSSLFILKGSAKTGETNSSDVETLALFNFDIPAGEDPCLPTPLSWLECSSDDTPRITALNLGDAGLYGAIPDFSAMDALEIIDLSDNLFSEEFPDFFANFPKLKVLNLAYNSFYGTIPTSLSNNKKLELTLTGMESLLCYSDEDTCETDTGTETSPGTNDGTPTRTYGLIPTGYTPRKTKSHKKKTVPIVLGTLIPIFLIFWAIVGLLVVNHQKKKAAAEQKNGAHAPGKQVHRNEMEDNTQSPNPLLPENEMKYQDPGLAAENVIPDHHEVDIDQQAYPTV
ncbi:hypothetical protein C5167_044925 [Papaver somniferum]|uniref:Leucine-rich repeat-containing N-terminal plant-type domain-containing protein n=1 Tax=Papaver somniferum TaxID=3469 RepID=A0A4Y7LD64_PAPSO|nr:LRR receptor-like serine/threonine-protein kinase IOS1 isoform X2 [Papaver somniferum]RZC82139.1 hypothetical protein C5167_044925 [Papaver somniferum]